MSEVHGRFENSKKLKKKENRNTNTFVLPVYLLGKNYACIASQYNDYALLPSISGASAIFHDA